MSKERRSCGTDPHVTKRLFAILVLMTGLLCVFGGYLLGRMARNETKRNTEMLTYNLTIAADNLYKKAARITPKVIHHNDSDKIQSRLIQIFNCSQCCGNLDKYSLGEFVKNVINYEVAKLLKAVHNATLFLDGLS